MKTLLYAAAATAALATGASAATVNLDFVALAAGTPGDRGGVEGQTFNFGGLGVTLSSTSTGSSSNAYLDDLSGGRPAGLGVCSAGLGGSGGAQCVQSGDDNVTMGEEVTLTFSQGIDSIGDFVFNDAEHYDISNSAGALGFSIVDGGGTIGWVTSFGGVEAAIAGTQIGLINSVTLSFASNDPNALEFYLGSATVEFSPVPLPASVLLLGGALAGAGALRRRRKAA